MLISLFRQDVLLSIIFIFTLIRRGLLACPPATLLILTDCFFFSGEGAFLPKGPFSLIDVRSFFAACVVSLFFLVFFSHMEPEKLYHMS